MTGGFAFREQCDVLSQNVPHRAGTEPSKIRLSAYSESAATRHKGASCLMLCVALKIWRRPFRYRLWWTCRSDDVWRNLDCPKQAEGGVMLGGMVARWGERNLGDVGRAA